jgi:hypothetical protein
VGKLWLAEGVIHVAATVPILWFGYGITDEKVMTVQFLKGNDLHGPLLSYKQNFVGFFIL